MWGRCLSDLRDVLLYQEHVWIYQRSVSVCKQWRCIDNNYLFHRFCLSGPITLCSVYWSRYKYEISSRMFRKDTINLLRYFVDHYYSVILSTIDPEDERGPRESTWTGNYGPHFGGLYHTGTRPLCRHRVCGRGDYEGHVSLVSQRISQVCEFVHQDRVIWVSDRNMWSGLTL